MTEFINYITSDYKNLKYENLILYYGLKHQNRKLGFYTYL